MTLQTPAPNWCIHTTLIPDPTALGSPAEGLTIAVPSDLRHAKKAKQAGRLRADSHNSHGLMGARYSMAVDIGPDAVHDSGIVPLAE